MKFVELFQAWGIKEIKLNCKFAEVEFERIGTDSEAAWELYIELLTRVTTQPIQNYVGNELSALSSVYHLFEVTREILKRKGENAPNTTKIAIIILNQIIRPFTSKWHKKSLEGAFEISEECELFRNELEQLQVKLVCYTRLLAYVAQVEDLTDIDN